MAALYGGFFALDLRLLLLMMLVALLGALGTVLAVKRLKLGRGLLPWVLVFFLGYFILLVVVFNVAVGYPVFVIRSFFKIP
jgi:hypothetical protein